MKQHLRPRNYILIGGTLLVMFFLWYSDPNGGALTTTLVAQLTTPVIAVWFAHIARKALFDYTNMQELYMKAKETGLGAAIIFASMCAVLFALLGLFGNQVKADPIPRVESYIPKQAVIYVPVLRSEQQTYWSAHPKPGT